MAPALRRFPVVVLACLLLAACGSPPAPTPERRPNVSGTITYRERMALPPSAVLEIRLVDLNRQDALRVITEQTISNPGQVPVRFRLFYRDRVIDPAGDYGIESRILIDGREAWRQPQPFPVLTKGRSSVAEIVLVPAGS